MAITQRELVEILSREVELGNAPPYFPAFFSSPTQASLADLQVSALSGKTFLDVGCNLGLRCFEAVQHGAARVVGIDVNPLRIAQARALSRALRLDVEFRHVDETGELPASDIVTCANVLNRARDPVALLDRLGAATCASLYLRFSTPTSSELAELAPKAGSLDDLPIIVVGRGGPSLRVPESAFYLTGAAIRNLLVHHQARFSDVAISDSTHPGDVVVRATRRRIRHLLVVAGVSGVGKTTFLERLKANGGASRRLIGIEDLANWRVVDALSYTELKGDAEKLCLHYDLSRAYRYPARGFEHDPVLQALRDAQHVTGVTLWAPPEIVRRRKTGRMGEQMHADKRLTTKLLETLRGRRRTGRDWAAQQAWDAGMLDHPVAVVAQYRRWLEYCDRAGITNNIIVDTSDEYRRVDPSALRA